MSIFYVWNPVIPPRKPDTIEFVLTRGDAFSVNKGTKKFFQEIFDELNLKEKVESWQVKKYRSKYYTDFLGEKDWRDNWQFVWRAEVKATSKIKDLPALNEPWIATDATDSTWKTKEDDDEEKVGCLVVADFENAAKLKAAKKAVEENKEIAAMQKKYSVDAPQFYETEMIGLYKQLQIDLGEFSGDFFADGAEYAELVRKICKKDDGTVHFADRAE